MGLGLKSKYVFPCMCPCDHVRVSKEAGKCQLLELGLQVVCEPFDVDAETLAWVLRKNSKASPVRETHM